MFWPFNKYPGSDYETFNYDWIIGKLKELKDSVAAALASEQAAAESAEEAHGNFVVATMQATRAETAARNAAESASEARETANEFSDDFADLTEQITLNSTRIDTLIANAGDGTIPSELVEVRNAYDGMVYATAGEAVRKQAKLRNVIGNVLTIPPISNGTIVNGSVGANTRRSKTDPFRINGPYTVVNFTNNTGYTIGFSFWEYRTSYADGPELIAKTLDRFDSNMLANGETASFMAVNSGWGRILFRTSANDLMSDSINELIDAGLTVTTYTPTMTKNAEKTIANTVITPALTWELGTLANGQPATNTKRIRTTDFIYAGKGSTIEFLESGKRVNSNIVKYDKYKQYTGDTGWVQGVNTLDTDCYIKILAAYTPAIDIDDVAALSAQGIINIVMPSKIPQDIYDLNDEIQDLRQDVENQVVAIPSYFVSQTDTAVENTRKHMDETGLDGCSFAFITDIHYETNAKHSDALLRYVMKEANLNRIVCGGDIINGGAKQTTLNYLSEVTSKYKEAGPWYCLFGNHDANTVNVAESEALDKKTYYARCQKQMDTLMDLTELCYFYFDDKTTKTRFVCLDTGTTGAIDNAQFTWLNSTLNAMPANWHAIIFAHWLYTAPEQIGPAPEDYTATPSARTLFTNVDTFNTARGYKAVCAIFAGHNHSDANFSTANGVPIILTDCDGSYTMSGSGGVRDYQRGTVTEQCFDMVTINYDTDTVYLERIGRGNSRTITSE